MNRGSNMYGKSNLAYTLKIHHSYLFKAVQFTLCQQLLKLWYIHDITSPTVWHWWNITSNFILYISYYVIQIWQYNIKKQKQRTAQTRETEGWMIVMVAAGRIGNAMKISAHFLVQFNISSIPNPQSFIFTLVIHCSLKTYKSTRIVHEGEMWNEFHGTADLKVWMIKWRPC